MKERTRVTIQGYTYPVKPGTWGKLMATWDKNSIGGIRQVPGCYVEGMGWYSFEFLEKENPTADNVPEWGELSP